jgi:hypothetical protein
MSTRNLPESASPEQSKPKAERAGQDGAASVESVLRRIADTMERPPKRPTRSRVETTTFAVAALGLIGIAACVITLIFNVASARRDDQRWRDQSAHEDHLGRYDAARALLINLDEAFIDRPQLQPFFWEGKPVDSTIDEALARTVVASAAQRVDAYQNLYEVLVTMKTAPDDGKFVLRQPDGPKGVNDDWLAWSETIEVQFRQSPAMCMVVTDQDSKKTFNAGFINALAAAHVCPNLTGLVA